MGKPLFEVDKEGLAQILARKGVEFAVTELIQNAWDEDVTTVAVELTAIPDRRARYRLRVTDDSPEGFRDLAHAYTLFADSYKKSDVRKRGRFNLGEKLVIALCDEATIASTKGTISFAGTERRHSRAKTEVGTVFDAIVRMTKPQAQRTVEVVRTLIPPPGIVTTLNGTPLVTREPLRTFTSDRGLQTEVADEDGNLKRTYRKTEVSIYKVLEGETAMLYELGIPVVETGDTWHIDIGQKVPLNTDRDNVPPSYLREVRAQVLNHCSDVLADDDAAESWVGNALESKEITPEALNAALDKRFGVKRVITDPSDPEANARAVAQGYAVVGSRSLSRAAWQNVKRAEAMKPAGQVTPSPKVHASANGAESMDESQWTPGMRAIHAYCTEVGERLIGAPITVKFHNDSKMRFGAWYGSRELTFNVGVLGYRFFDQGATEKVNSLLIHELGHEYSSNHLSHEYFDALCDLGARLAQLALDEPGLFAVAGDGQEREAAAIA